MAKIINLGKGTKGTGINNKLSLVIAHPQLGIAVSLTFWAVAEFQGTEKIITDADAIKLLNNLVPKTNDNGTFMVWNGKLD